MFTGIIESLAKLVSIEKNGDNITFTFNSKISNELKIDTDKNISTFIGNVNATNQNLKVWSDKMIITLKEDNDNVKKIRAIGNVKIIRIFEGTEIYGEVANYSIENEFITIDKNVIIIEDGNEVRGSHLIVDLKKKKKVEKEKKIPRLPKR